MNEDQKTKGSARIEFVPFPSADDGSTPVDAGDVIGATDVIDAIDADDEGSAPSASRSKGATGWAASGLAGALKRSRRQRDKE